MAKLIKCLECGGLISNKAHSCPHCDSPHPCGYECAVCRKAVSAPEARVVNGKFMHAECQDRVSRLHYSCPTCSHTITTLERSACPQCGHPIEKATCIYCWLPLITDAATDVSGGSYYEGYRFAHPACVASRNPAPFWLRQPRALLVSSARALSRFFGVISAPLDQRQTAFRGGSLGAPGQST